VCGLEANKPDKEFFMTTQTNERSLTTRPNEQQGQQGQSLQRSSNETVSSRRRSYLPGFGISPLELFNNNPFSLMRRMTEEMDRVVQEFGLTRGEGNRGGWLPAIEVSESDGKYNVRAELPGLSPNDVKVEVADNALVIQGERKIEHEEKEGGERRTERQYGVFYRSIPLPEGADAEHASARFQNGLLEVTVPVPQQREQRRSIPIEGESRSQADAQKQAA
jgi:HSP20 family protein